MNLLTCRCGEAFIGEFFDEKRPVFESLRKMRKAGRDNLQRTGTEVVPVCPALCPDCRQKPPLLPLVTDWESEESDDD